MRAYRRNLLNVSKATFSSFSYRTPKMPKQRYSMNMLLIVTSYASSNSFEPSESKNNSNFSTAEHATSNPLPPADTQVLQILQLHPHPAV